MDQERANLRKRVLKGGLILFNNHRSSVNCTVRDFSETGAKLRMEAATSVPDNFDLMLPQENLIYPAEVAWRRALDIGVRFTGPAGPVKRSQPH